jgi:hypothetical protein
MSGGEGQSNSGLAGEMATLKNRDYRLGSSGR